MSYDGIKRYLSESWTGAVKKLLAFGRFLRIVDERENQLSVVNAACIVVVVKVATSVDPSMAELGSLLIALLAHYGKKRINEKTRTLDSEQNKQIAEMQTKLKELGDRVGSVAAALGFKNIK